jgi:hypothetical protein
VLAQQATDFGHRIWCYTQIAFQLFVERVAMDFPESDEDEVLNILVRRSREIEYGDDEPPHGTAEAEGDL